MKVSIITMNGTKIEGNLSSTGRYIVSLDVPSQLVNAQLVETLHAEEISATEFDHEWQIIVARDKVKSIVFND